MMKKNIVIMTLAIVFTFAVGSLSYTALKADLVAGNDEVTDPYSTNETVFVPYTEDSSKPVRLTSMGDYAEDCKYGKRWRIRNEQSEALDVSWEIYNSDISGDFSIPADTEVHFTSHYADEEGVGATMKIYYNGETQTSASSNSVKVLSECSLCDQCSDVFASKDELSTLSLSVDDHETRIGNNEVAIDNATDTNNTQDLTLSDHETRIGNNEVAIDNATDTNNTQDLTLSDHETRISDLESSIIDINNALDSINLTLSDLETRITALEN
jgi:hypothetical protein